MANRLDFKINSFTVIELSITVFLSSILITIFFIGIGNLKKTFLNISYLLSENNELKTLNAQLLHDFYLTYKVSYLADNTLILHQNKKDIIYEIKDNFLNRVQKNSRIKNKIKCYSIEKSTEKNGVFYIFNLEMNEEMLELKFKPLTTINQPQYQFN